MSLLIDAPFEQVTLAYSVEGAQTGTDGNGNPAFGASAGSVLALFAPYLFDQLRLQPGSDPKIIAGRGELLEPLNFPLGVGVGSVLTCTFADQRVEVTIKTIIPNDLVGVAFGAAFTADMRVL